MLVLVLGAACGRGEPGKRGDAESAPDGPNLKGVDGLEALDVLATRYGLQIVARHPVFPVTTRHGVIDGREASVSELQSYVDLLVFEFSLYPPDLVRRARLDRIVLCTQLSLSTQPRSAIPDWQHDTLYLDVSGGRWRRHYARRVIHHEFFHLLDYRDDGEVYSDERWRLLNAPNVEYGHGGRAAQASLEESTLTDHVPGFLDHYATTGVEEDKAEVFACLMCEPTYVAERCQVDAILRSKVERMKMLLAEFCPAMDDAFWARVSVVSR